MRAGKNKLLIDLEGESLIYWTLKSVFSASSTNWVGIIGQPKDKNLLLNSAKDFADKVHWINGGDTRQQSVFNGLKGLPKDAEKVLIHDGARCLINPELIDLCAKELDKNEAVILATKVTDTIKIVDNEGFIKETPDRFFAYNNGVSATADDIEFDEENGYSISKIRNLQIVNGGQTTASLYYTAKKDKADLQGIFVQAKISVIPEEHLEHIVPLISRFPTARTRSTMPTSTPMTHSM